MSSGEKLHLMVKARNGKLYRADERLARDGGRVVVDLVKVDVEAALQAEGSVVSEVPKVRQHERRKSRGRKAKLKAPGVRKFQVYTTAAWESKPILSSTMSDDKETSSDLLRLPLPGQTSEDKRDNKDLLKPRPSPKRKSKKCKQNAVPSHEDVSSAAPESVLQREGDKHNVVHELLQAGNLSEVMASGNLDLRLCLAGCQTVRKP